MQKFELEEFTVRKVDNGFTVRIEYKEPRNDGYMVLSTFKNLIAPDLEAVLTIMREYCEREKNG